MEMHSKFLAWGDCESQLKSSELPQNDKDSQRLFPPKPNSALVTILPEKRIYAQQKGTYFVTVEGAKNLVDIIADARSPEEEEIYSLPGTRSNENRLCSPPEGMFCIKNAPKQRRQSSAIPRRPSILAKRQSLQRRTQSVFFTSDFCNLTLSRDPLVTWKKLGDYLTVSVGHHLRNNPRNSTGTDQRLTSPMKTSIQKIHGSMRESPQSETECEMSPNESRGDLAFQIQRNRPQRRRGSEAKAPCHPYLSEQRKHKSLASIPVDQVLVGNKLGYYGIKKWNDHVYGKSVCFIIANFTGELTGYQNDIISIDQFHKEKLKSRVFHTTFQDHYSMNNLSEKYFRDLLYRIQYYLKEGKDMQNIDSFFMYILSHGNQDGIIMCAEGSNTTPETVDVYHNEKPIKVKITVPMKDIIDMFSDDQVPHLKGYPKVFINQSCKGDQFGSGNDSVDPDSSMETRASDSAGPDSSMETRASDSAGPDSSMETRASDSAGPDSSMETRASDSAGPDSSMETRAFGSDIIVCEAASTRTMSYVSWSGSLLIQKLITAMTKYCSREHFTDILVQVVGEISREVYLVKARGQNQIVEAYQMPRIYSRLTKKFFLARPVKKL